MAVSDAILERLLKLHPKIIDLSLDRMWRILAALGNPHQALAPVIHVAGTNGKGSTVAYLRAMLEAAGLRVHVYTSPHLVRFHERIRLGGPDGGGLIAEDSLVQLLEECEQANGGQPITFFEITTAAAMLAFARQPADYVLLEVGLGGRLDATNVVDNPAVTAITPVAMDHQQYLGETLEDIAGEKAGILKPGVPACCGPQEAAALAVIESRAVDVGAPLTCAGRDYQCFEQYGRLVYQDDRALLDLDLPGLTGRFQIDNAGLAIAIARILGDKRVSSRHVGEGLQNARWSARMERLENGRLHEVCGPGAEIWLDGGHNPAAGHAVASALADLGERAPMPLMLITGMLNTKQPDGYLEPFAGLVSKAVTVAIPGETNTLSADALANSARKAGIAADAASSLEDAFQRAAHFVAEHDRARLVIGGSLYLAGHVLRMHRHADDGSQAPANRAAK